MKLSAYLKDKLLIILILLFMLIMIFITLLVFEVNKYLIIMIILINIFTYFGIILYDYLKKRIFYNNLCDSLESIDQKYLVHEMVKEPNFLEGEIFYNALSVIDKVKIEEINKYKYRNIEFREYLELWCHEIKTPVATANLIIDNHHNVVTDSIKEEIDRIESYIEQVLYYSRSDNVEKDYLITDVELKKIVATVVKKNRKDLISRKIKIDIGELHSVRSDPKWLEFIINQIIINSIKYSKKIKPFIKISSVYHKNSLALIIEDNGIGIKDDEIERVFDKGFTGSNGRRQYASTGIGLYLCKKLCNKLNHDIKITSRYSEGTTVIITFPDSSMINNVTKL